MNRLRWEQLEKKKFNFTPLKQWKLKYDDIVANGASAIDVRDLETVGRKLKLSIMAATSIQNQANSKTRLQ